MVQPRSTSGKSKKRTAYTTYSAAGTAITASSAPRQKAQARASSGPS
jgi:hypothetical protein